ncbi:hypothetical protein [Anabaena sp. CCY 9402-a]
MLRELTSQHLRDGLRPAGGVGAASRRDGVPPTVGDRKLHQTTDF